MKNFFITFIWLFSMLFLTNPVFSQVQIQITQPPNTVSQNIRPNDIVRFTFNVIIFIGIIASLIFLIHGGIKWISSGGDKQSIESAKGQITAAIVGLVLLILTWVIVGFVFKVLGLPSPGSITVPRIEA